MAEPTHKYTILSMMKDEGHSLVEWVAYHNHIGFDNICVYTNDCSDGTDEMLIRLEHLGWVKHFRNDVPEDKRPQPNALQLATKNEQVMDSEWVLVMDADEFLSIKVGRGRVSDLIAEIPENACAMAITWRFFGSSDLTDWNPGLVIENYTRSAPDLFKKGWGVKTIFKPYHDIKLGIHRPHIKKAKQDPVNAKILFDQIWVNGSGEPMPEEFSLSGWRSTKPTIGYKLAELNHYAVKSYEAYLLRRIRGNVNNKADKYDAAYFALFDRNEEENTNVTQHLAGVKSKMTAILADPKMRELQDKALEFHANRVATLRESGEYDQWLVDLKEAGKTPIDKIDEILFIQHLPKLWQAKVAELKAKGVPDKVIAKMIAQTQTAKKGETRAALIAVAKGETVPEPADETGNDADMAILRAAQKARVTLDNPFADVSGDVETLDLSVREDKATVVDAVAPLVAVDSVVAPETPTPEMAAVPKMTDEKIRGRFEGKFQSKTDPETRQQGTDLMSENRVVLVSTMKNEGPYLLEWLAYHKSIGIDEFCIYSNDCTDGTNLMLNRLDQLGVVRHFDNPLGPRMDPQRAAYSRAGKQDWVRSADYILIVDADEFLNVHTGDRTVHALIDACKGADAISINWRLMGSCGYGLMDGALVTERFTRGSTFEVPENGMVWGFKTLFRPNKFDFFGVHRPKFFKDREIIPGMARWVNGDGDVVEGQILQKGWRSNNDSLGYSLAQVNHYAVKSREDFLLKRLRGTANSKNKDRINMEYWQKYDLNANEDTTIPTDQIFGIIEEWLKDPDLAALNRACLHNSRLVLDYQMEVPEFRRFVDTGEWDEAAA
ncbi:MAG: glycosyltransferase family 2 protein [Paracoccaceae bacterium]